MNKKAYTLEEARAIVKLRREQYQKALDDSIKYYKGEYHDAVTVLSQYHRDELGLGSDSKGAVDREIIKARYESASAEYKRLVREKSRAKLKEYAAEGVLEAACADRLYEKLNGVLFKYLGKPAGPKTTEKFNKELAESCGFDRVRFSEYGIFYADVDGTTYNVYIYDCIVDRENTFSSGWDVSPDYKTGQTFPATDEDWNAWCDRWIESYEGIQKDVQMLAEKASEFGDLYNIGEARLPYLYSKSLCYPCDIQ